MLTRQKILQGGGEGGGDLVPEDPEIGTRRRRRKQCHGRAMGDRQEGSE